MAIIIPALPYNLTNGTTADANQVMADFNDVVSGVNTNGAHNGPNSDITALTGLTTPLTAAQGGTGVGAPGPAGNMLTSNGGLWQSVAPGPGLRGDPSTGLVGLAAIIPPGGRLTLASGVPVMTVDVAAATTIYYTPYNGNNIPVYNGTVFVPYAFPEISLALNATPHVANTNYDLFVWNNFGTLQLVSGPAWSSATARVAALALVNGIQTNAASLSAIAGGNTPVTVPVNQGIYVGTFRTLAAGQTAMVMNPAAASGGNASILGLWNNYNRVKLRGVSIDNGVSYTYSATTIRQARASAGNQVNFICGLLEETISIELFTCATSGASGSAKMGFGLDTTTAFSENNNQFVQANPVGTTPTTYIGWNSHEFAAQIGFHFVSANEASGAAGINQTFDALGSNQLQVMLRG
jgi:hypothetical protein